jgi:hypothetical protein
MSVIYCFCITICVFLYSFLHLRMARAGPNRVVNKHRLSYVGFVCDYLFYKEEHNGMSALKAVSLDKDCF